MKYAKFLQSAAVAAVALLSIGTAQAASITGTLVFGGEALTIEDISEAVGLSFDNGFFVTNASGDFDAVGLGFGNQGAIADFMFSPLDPAPVNAFLTIGVFSFSLESVQIVDQQDIFLALTGTGTLSGSGFDNTAFDISMSIDGAGSNYAYSGTIAQVVPVPGALLLMLTGLTALGFTRRS